MPKKREFITIFIIQITEVLGFSLILPFLPLYAKELGATPLTVGLMLTVFSIFQLISSPVLGRLSDRYGRRPLLIVSQISTFISFVVLAFANSIPLLFISRSIDGLFGSNYSIAQAYLSDISSKKNRSKIFGLSGMAFGIGFLIGPAMGGFLAQYGFWVPAAVASIISFLTVIMTFLFLPETVKKNQKGKQEEIKIFDSKPFIKFFNQKNTRQMLTIWFIYIFAHVLWTTNFALYADLKYGIGPKEIGLILTYIGISSLIVRGALIPKLVDKVDERKVISFGLISIFLGLIGTVFLTNIIAIGIILTLFSLGASLLRPLLLSDISRKVSEKEQGSIMGVTNSINSLAQIISPIIGGILLTYTHHDSLMLLAALIICFAFFIFRNGTSIPKTKHDHK